MKGGFESFYNCNISPTLIIALERIKFDGWRAEIDTFWAGERKVLILFISMREKALLMERGEKQIGLYH